MPLLPIIPALLPLLGAAGTVGLPLLPRALRPYVRYVALVIGLGTVGCAVVLLLAFRWVAPVTVIPSLWQPSYLFGPTLALRYDSSTYPLALVLTVATCAALLGEARNTDLSPRLVATILALLAAGMFSVCAANILTILVAWTTYDLLQAAGRIAAGGSSRRALHGLFLGSLATLLLWIGALLSAEGAINKPWALMALGDVQTTLWIGAGIIRLWVYPFHLSAPDEAVGPSSLAIPLSLGPVVGWGWWLRLVELGGGIIPTLAWTPVLAVIAMVLGSLLAWSCEDPRRILPWAAMSATGALLLAAVLVGRSAQSVILVGAVSWALGVTVLAVGVGLTQAGVERRSVWWGVPTWVGALALLGLPPTLGFLTGASLTGQLARGGYLGWGAAFFIGQVILIPSLARWLMLPTPSAPSPRRWESIVWGAGLGMLALVLIVTGLAPSLVAGGDQRPSLAATFALPGLGGWLLWTVALAIGGLLVWQDGNVRSRIEHLLDAAHDLLRLEWLYDIAGGALDRGLGVLRAADDIVGGAGALLWSLALFLVLVLIWGP